MEDALDRRTVRQQGGVPTGGFYDVTSSYLEGACHALAAFGDNRDNKAGKTQIVIGLVTTGRPRSDISSPHHFHGSL